MKVFLLGQVNKNDSGTSLLSFCIDNGMLRLQVRGEVGQCADSALLQHTTRYLPDRYWYLDHSFFRFTLLCVNSYITEQSLR